MKAKHQKEIGKTYNSLTIIDTWTGKKSRAHCSAKCSCGNIVESRIDAVKSGRRTCCLKCTSKWRQERYAGENNHSWRGVKKVPSVYFWDSKRNAKRRKIEFKITHKYIGELFENQNGICPLTGLKLVFGKTRSPNTTASLDRIDSSKGYIEGNVQWVHKDINIMKKAYPQDYFIKLCKLVAEQNYA